MEESSQENLIKNEESLRFLVLTDNHLGYKIKDKNIKDV